MSKGILSGTASSGFAAGAGCAAGGCCATDRAVTKRARPRTDSTDMVASPVRDEILRLRRRRRCALMLAYGIGLPRERIRNRFAADTPREAESRRRLRG